VIRLSGLFGGDLFGFMASVGALAVLDGDARARGMRPPKLRFAADQGALLDDAGDDEDVIIDATLAGLQRVVNVLQGPLRDVSKPSDFSVLLFDEIARTADRTTSDLMAGLACSDGNEITESSLCAANGAGHQNLIQSMRDVLGIVQREHIRTALFVPWKRAFEVTPELARTQSLGNRKPTLRLDPSDERLYALRAENPTASTSGYRTELGGQALAVAAFALLPVLPGRRPMCVASKREPLRVVFHWPLWDAGASVPTVRSLLWTGVEDEIGLRARGVFCAFRAARVSGAKGKLSFAPSEGVW